MPGVAAISPQVSNVTTPVLQIAAQLTPVAKNLAGV
jgi:hypothetical protein